MLKSNWEIIKGNLFTYFNLVFLIITIILLSVGSYRDLTFLPVIIANTLTGIIQELRSKRTLEKLTILNAPRVKVFRDGKWQGVRTEEILVGEKIRLKAGDQIPADARVIEGELMVNEALLTGETDEIPKKEGDRLMSGSFVVSGEAEVKATKVGLESYAGKLTLKAKAIKTGEQSEILRSLNKIMTILGIVIVPLGVAMVSEQVFLKGEGLQESVRTMVAAVLGMIPEGLFLLATATLAISVMRLARQEVLVHEMKCIETLARVDVLCVDKTGTITEDKMEVEEVLENVEGGSTILSEFIKAQKADNMTMKALKEWRRNHSVSSSVPPGSRPPAVAGVAPLSRRFAPASQGANGRGLRNATQKIDVYGFSPKYKYSAAVIDGVKYVLGGPELAGMTVEGTERVLVFGRYEGKLGAKLTKKIQPLAVIKIMNKVRETAAETFRYFVEQGVEVKVISGDNPVTVSEVAKKAGIMNADKYIDLTGVTGKKLVEAAQEYTVFGRVTPEQKQKLIKALQKAGHTVAMTGDGVNDVLALKDADCSVAMASGAQAAVQVAQLVLLDSDFARMPEVVKEGRRVVNNLERSGSLFLVKNIFSLTMAVLVIILTAKYPLVPNQLTLVTTWTIGIPSFLLAQMPNHRLIKGDFISNIMKRAFWGALADVMVVGVIALVGRGMGLEFLQVGTCCAIGMAIVGMIYLYIIAKPLDVWKRVVIVGCVAGLVASIIFMPSAWNLVAPW